MMLSVWFQLVSSLNPHREHDVMSSFSFPNFWANYCQTFAKENTTKITYKNPQNEKMQNSKTSKAIPLLKSTRPPNPRLSSVNVRDVSSIGPGGHMGRIAILECSTMLCMLQIDNNF